MDAPDPFGPSSSSGLSKLSHQFNQKLQILLDKLSPHITSRWVAMVLSVLIYIIRVWALRGFYIVSYGLGIYNLNLLLGFLTPQFDPESEGPVLPTKAEEFKPFVRRLPEFKFWYSSIKSVFVGFCMTFFSMFDVPVFWPILLMYWFILFFVTMKRQIMHMIKHKYIPFSFGKKRYNAVGRGESEVKDSR